jgi:hypothetical protein
MGNRGGALHNSNREIIRTHKSRRWITCLLEFRGRRRVVMAANRYTELFFLDEAVAFAAGHRPCAECRRQSYNAFRDAWQVAHHLKDPPFADEMDLELHSARIDRQKKKITFQATLGTLPDAVFVEIEGSAYASWNGALLLWTPDGYVQSHIPPTDATVTVLTPKSIVDCFRQGYKPEIHYSGLFVNLVT